MIVVRGDEQLAPSGGHGWSVTLEVKGYGRETTKGRQLKLPVPAVSVGNPVTLKASLLGHECAATSLERTLNAGSSQQICSMPLRVYAQVQGTEVIGRCELLSGVVEGEVEYAFYLLVGGCKT